MSTSGWSLPARAKTRGLDCPLHSHSQLVPSRVMEESIFLEGPAKISVSVHSKGLYLNIR